MNQSKNTEKKRRKITKPRKNQKTTKPPSATVVAPPPREVGLGSRSAQGEHLSPPNVYKGGSGWVP